MPSSSYRARVMRTPPNFAGALMASARTPEATDRAVRQIESILRQRSYDETPFSQILALLKKYRGIERVKERAQAFTDKARQIIAEFPDSPYQRALMAVTELITERDH